MARRGHERSGEGREERVGRIPAVNCIQWRRARRPNRLPSSLAFAASAAALCRPDELRVWGSSIHRRSRGTCVRSMNTSCGAILQAEQRRRQEDQQRQNEEAARRRAEADAAKRREAARHQAAQVRRSLPPFPWTQHPLFRGDRVYSCRSEANTGRVTGEEGEIGRSRE